MPMPFPTAPARMKESVEALLAYGFRRVFGSVDTHYEYTVWQKRDIILIRDDITGDVITSVALAHYGNRKKEIAEQVAAVPVSALVEAAVESAPSKFQAAGAAIHKAITPQLCEWCGHVHAPYTHCPGSNFKAIKGSNV